MRERDLLRQLVARTTLPWRGFDITDNDIRRVADEVADWLEQADGLWIAYD
jgi:hypothetical protein